MLQVNGVLHLYMLVENEIANDSVVVEGVEPKDRWRDVFISHASGDIQLAQKICKELEANNLQCWIAPRDIPAGSYPEQIDDGINKCRCLLLILSESSNNSKWVLREVTTAANLNKIILTFRITEQPSRKGLRILTSDQQDLNAWSAPPDSYIDQLVIMLRAACLSSQIESKQQSPELRDTLGLGNAIAITSADRRISKHKKIVWWSIFATAFIVLTIAVGAYLYQSQKTPVDEPVQPSPEDDKTNPTETSTTTDPPLPIATPTAIVSMPEAIPTRPSPLDIVRSDYEQLRSKINVDGWQPSLVLYQQAHKTAGRVNSTTSPDQAVEAYTQAIATLTIAQDQYDAAFTDGEARLDQARNTITMHPWCEQCPEIQTLVGDLTLQLAAIKAAFSPTSITASASALDTLLTKIAETKKQSASGIAEYHNSRKASLRASIQISEEAFERASGFILNLNGLIHSPLQGSTESSPSARAISLSAELCILTIEARGSGQQSIQSQRAELHAFADQSTPLSDENIARSADIQRNLSQTADLLAAFTIMLKSELDARTALAQLFHLYAETPTNSDKSTDFFNQSLQDSIAQREQAIREADQLQSSFAMAAFSKLLADTTESIAQNRRSRYQSAHRSVVSISVSIQQTYATAFNRGLRIPIELTDASANLKTHANSPMPSESDIVSELRLAQQFQDVRVTLDIFSDQASRVQTAPYPFHEAAQAEQASLLNDYLALGVSINVQRPSDMQGILHIAATNNLLALADWILSFPQADLETQEIDGYTPLAMAALNGHIQMLSILIDRNANIFPINNTNIPVIFERDVLIKKEIVFMLLDEAQRSGLSVSAIRGKQDRTLLIEIANAGGRNGLSEPDQIEIAERLIQMGIDPDGH